MPKWYRNPEEYANERMLKVEKENERLNKCLGEAEKTVRDIKLQLLQLQENCPHITTKDNDRPTADEPSTKTCRACGFTQ